MVKILPQFYFVLDSVELLLSLNGVQVALGLILRLLVLLHGHVHFLNLKHLVLVLLLPVHLPLLAGLKLVHGLADGGDGNLFKFFVFALPVHHDFEVLLLVLLGLVANELLFFILLLL